LPEPELIAADEKRRRKKSVENGDAIRDRELLINLKALMAGQKVYQAAKFCTIG